jgi:hypothetical protein
MVEIKDKDILEAFKIGENPSDDKVIHGVVRDSKGTLIVYERNKGEAYSGFLEKSRFDLSTLNEMQIDFLKGKGYEI